MHDNYNQNIYPIIDEQKVLIKEKTHRFIIFFLKTMLNSSIILKLTLKDFYQGNPGFISMTCLLIVLFSIMVIVSFKKSIFLENFSLTQNVIVVILSIELMENFQSSNNFEIFISNIRTIVLLILLIISENSSCFLKKILHFSILFGYLTFRNLIGGLLQEIEITFIYVALFLMTYEIYIFFKIIGKNCQFQKESSFYSFFFT